MTKTVGFIQPTAICRHAPGDPSCGSNRFSSYSEPIKKSNDSPDSDNFEIEEIEEVGSHLVLKVKYPNCVKCSFEGNKVMVFLNTKIKDAIKWREIDPHFRLKAKVINSKFAPGPDARFPASQDGWVDAMNYARSK